jgi:hypothetical protein
VANPVTQELADKPVILAWPIATLKSVKVAVPDEVGTKYILLIAIPVGTAPNWPGK